MLTTALAARADDDTLLALLFLPGFSTRDTTDLLAGRGIGLDIAHVAVQRLGGRVHLSSRKGEGLSAAVEVPVESGFAKVLWVEAGGETYALLAADVASVKRTKASPRRTSRRASATARARPARCASSSRCKTTPSALR